MSDPDLDAGSPTTSVPGGGQGVLANLPRTRPQRSSPRRDAARKATAVPATANAERTSAPALPNMSAPAQPKQKAAKPRGSSASKRRGATAGASPSSPSDKQRPPRAVKRPTVASEPVPRQGFESPAESTSGPVHPPGGAEFLASVAEIVGELAKAGVSTGERVLKDVFSRLPLS